MNHLEPLAAQLASVWSQNPADMPQHVVAAVSGGSDSVAMLWVLYLATQKAATAPQRSAPTLTVVHVHHGLRGHDADNDQTFVTQLATRLGLAIRVTRLDRAQLKQTDNNVLAAARTLRHAFLLRTLQSLGTGWIALGHTKDDQIEHLWMRAQRSSGWRGQSPLPMQEGHLWRPLLEQSRVALQHALQTIGQPWRDDASNLNLDRRRSHTRHVALPRLTKTWPKIDDDVLRFGRAIRRCRSALLGTSVGSFAPHMHGLWLHWSIRQRPLLAAEWCNEAAHRMGRKLSQGLLHRMTHQIDTPDQPAVWLDRSRTAMAVTGRLLLLHKPLPPRLPITLKLSALAEGWTDPFDGVTVRLDIASAPLPLSQGALVIRGAQRGDRIGTMTLTRWLGRTHIPRPLWPWVRVAVAHGDDNQILAVESHEQVFDADLNAIAHLHWVAPTGSIVNP